MITTQSTTTNRFDIYNPPGLGNPQVIGLVEFEEASGSTIFDAAGRSYVDFYLNGCLPLGHSHQVLRTVSSIKHPLNIGLYKNSWKRQLDEKMAEVFPGYGAFHFSSCGTAANEALLRFAMAITGRNSFCGFQGAFHGRSKALTSVSDMEPCNGRRISGYFQLPYPHYNPIFGGYDSEREVSINDIAVCIDAFGAQNIAGMLIEPILSKPVIPLPKGWLKALKEQVLDPRGILLLADEFLTAGRVGGWSVALQEEVRPSLISYGKMFVTGMSFAGIACEEQYIENAYYVKGNDTYGGQPQVCHNVLLTVEEIESKALHQRAEMLEREFIAKIGPSVVRKGVKRVFAKGALWVVEFDDREIASRVAASTLKQGALTSVIKRGIRLTPALNIEAQELSRGLTALDVAIQEVCK